MRRNFITFILLSFFFTLVMPSTGLCKKKKDERKDKGHNKYYRTDKENKAYFNEEVKEKVDKILKGALKSVKAPERSKKEKEPIPDRYLDDYEQEVEYDYDYSKKYKGDEDDYDFELEDINSNKIKKFIENNDKKRNKSWGWYWDKNNKKHRKKKHGKWDIYPILKKLAWKHYRIALQYHDKANYKMAKKHLRIALWYWPAFVEAHTQLGVENMLLDHLDWAEINLKRAIKIDPEFGKAYYILSILYLNKEPAQIFDSVEACEYSKELKYTPEPEFYEFLNFVAELPIDDSSYDEEEPEEEPLPDEEKPKKKKKKEKKKKHDGKEDAIEKEKPGDKYDDDDDFGKGKGNDKNDDDDKKDKDKKNDDKDNDPDDGNAGKGNDGKNNDKGKGKNK